MGKYHFEGELFLGYSCCGSVAEKYEGDVELTDQEVNELVSLIVEEGTSDVEELDLEERLPEIYEKLEDAHRDAAREVEYVHWLYYGFDHDCYEVDMDELMRYCEEHNLYTFDPTSQMMEGEEPPTLDELSDPESCWYDLQREDFERWLPEYVYNLDRDKAVKFMIEQLHIDTDMDGDFGEIEVTIPDEIIGLAEVQEDEED